MKKTSSNNRLLIVRYTRPYRTGKSDGEKQIEERTVCLPPIPTSDEKADVAKYELRNKFKQFPYIHDVEIDLISRKPISLPRILRELDEQLKLETSQAEPHSPIIQ